MRNEVGHRDTNRGFSKLGYEKDQLHSAGNRTFISYYNYDAQGNRTRKVVEKGNIIETRYYINGYEVYRKENKGTLDTERTTLNISDDDKVFVRIETKTGENPVVRYQYDNHLGSACLELDKQGNIISYEEYHPFGTTSYRSGKTETEVSLKRYKYCGKERDEETGLYYYGMRYYAAWICRFISVDPLQFEYPYYTPYQYAGNKPISFIDLDGAEPGVLFENKFTNRIIEESYKPKPDSYKEGIKNGKIVYTQNYGWVDKTHAFTKTKRENVGADNLWNQIKNETGKQVTSKGEKGFLVTYRQDANVFGFSIGVEKTYFLKNGISIEDKERIAMAIFQEVSSKFENLQKYAFWSSSSFEPADLPSNILSFYSAVRPELTKEKILDLIQPLTMEQSLEVYKNYPGTFTDKQYKNKTFNPVFFPNEYSAENPQVPSELQEIQPAEKGNLFWNY